MARYAERKKGTLLFKGKTESQVLRSTREENAILLSPLSTTGSRQKTKLQRKGRKGETVGLLIKRNRGGK